jgi:hypothetical protein
LKHSSNQAGFPVVSCGSEQADILKHLFHIIEPFSRPIDLMQIGIENGRRFNLKNAPCQICELRPWMAMRIELCGFMDKGTQHSGLQRVELRLSTFCL